MISDTNQCNRYREETNHVCENSPEENAKAFGCSRWREGCRFTLWKNAVSGAGGPELNAKIVTALLKAPDGDLRGSTGTLHYHEGTVGFTPKAPR